MHACMHVCMYVCMYVCIYVLMYVYIYVHMYMCNGWFKGSTKVLGSGFGGFGCCGLVFRVEGLGFSGR